MKNIIYYLLLTLSLIGCNKIELPDGDDNKEKEEDTEKNENADKHPDHPENDEDFLSISQALATAPEKTVNLQGYMVGYVSGTSIKTSSKFEIPVEKENTNFLLADTPNEEDMSHCLPVKLEKTGKFATREALNMYDHPELYKKFIRITGFLGKYFSRNGITRIGKYEISDKEEDTPKEEDKDQPDTLHIDQHEQVVPDGRCLRNS